MTRALAIRLDGTAEDVVVDRVRWNTEDDPCGYCAALDGHTVRAGDAFLLGVWSPPLHPHCKCSLVLVGPDGEESEYASYSIVTPDDDAAYESYSVTRSDAAPDIQEQIRIAWARRLANGGAR